VRLVLDLLDLIELILSATIPIGIALLASNKPRKTTLIITWFVLPLWIIFRLIINPLLLCKAKIISTNCTLGKIFADLITRSAPPISSISLHHGIIKGRYEQRKKGLINDIISNIVSSSNIIRLLSYTSLILCTLCIHILNPLA